jgi:hypothetical protein
MSRTIYIAGGSPERELVSGYMTQLRAAGWRVSLDWTVFYGHPEAARLDFDGVWNADFFWLILPREKSEGAFFEFGAACSASATLRESETSDRSITVIVSGYDGERDAQRIFVALANRVFPQHGQALGWLLGQT